MTKANLYTRDMKFVTALNEEHIVPFVLWPEVIFWGYRTFVRNVFADTIEVNRVLTLGYTEAYMWCVPVLNNTEKEGEED